MEQAKVLKVTIVERHSHFTFIPGASVRTYSDKQLKELNDKEKETFKYKDKEYTYYEATQYQRDLENKIRKLKREAILYEQTGLKQELNATNKEIKDIRNEYKAFSNASRIKAKMDRTQI